MKVAVRRHRAGGHNFGFHGTPEKRPRDKLNCSRDTPGRLRLSQFDPKTKTQDSQVPTVAAEVPVASTSSEKLLRDKLNCFLSFAPTRFRQSRLGPKTKTENSKVPTGANAATNAAVEATAVHSTTSIPAIVLEGNGGDTKKDTKNLQSAGAKSMISPGVQVLQLEKNVRATPASEATIFEFRIDRQREGVKIPNCWTVQDCKAYLVEQGYVKSSSSSASLTAGDLELSHALGGVLSDGKCMTAYHRDDVILVETKRKKT